MANDHGNWWEADERPEPRSLGLLPSGSDPVGEWLVHRQPPVTYIGPIKRESKQRRHASLLAFLREESCGFVQWIQVATKDWSPHTQLAQETVPVGDLPLARVLLANDANYPWLILVPRLPGLVELIDLEENAQVQLLGEIAAAARALKTITACDKLNIAALGNQVPQLHVHVIARRRTDAAWPKPVWGVQPPLAYKEGLQAALLNSLRQLLKSSGLVGIDH